MAGTKKRASARKSSTAKRSRAIVVARPANSLDSLFGGMDLNLGMGGGLSALGGGLGGLGGGLGIGSLGMGSDIYGRSLIMPQLLQAKLMEHKFAMALKKAQLKGALGLKEWQLTREMKAQEAAIEAVSSLVKKRQNNYQEALKNDNNPYLKYLNALKTGLNEVVLEGSGNGGGGGGGGGGMVGPAPSAPPAPSSPFANYNGYGGGYEGFSGGGLDDYSGYGDGDLDLFSGQYY